MAPSGVAGRGFRKPVGFGCERRERLRSGLPHGISPGSGVTGSPFYEEPVRCGKELSEFVRAANEGYGGPVG